MEWPELERPMLLTSSRWKQPWKSYEGRRLSFASPLKDAVAAEHGYDDWRKFKEEKPEDYRDQCQRIGAARRAEEPRLLGQPVERRS